MSQLRVHQINGGWGLTTVSPFCLKLELYLRMAEIPNETVYDATPFGAPKGKFPWIEHDGAQIGDSGLIIEYLISKFGFDPDSELSKVELATAHSIRRLLEENLYWTMVYDRWTTSKNRVVASEVVLGAVPKAIRPGMVAYARWALGKQLDSHGIGRHSAEEIHAIGCADVRALSVILRESPFLMGDKPALIDTSAYGVLATIANVPIATPIKDEILNSPNLVEYLARIRSRYFD